MTDNVVCSDKRTPSKKIEDHKIMPIQDGSSEDKYSTDSMNANCSKNLIQNLDMEEFRALDLKIKNGSANKQENARFNQLVPLIALKQTHKYDNMG